MTKIETKHWLTSDNTKTRYAVADGILTGALAKVFMSAVTREHRKQLQWQTSTVIMEGDTKQAIDNVHTTNTSMWKSYLNARIPEIKRGKHGRSVSIYPLTTEQMDTAAQTLQAGGIYTKKTNRNTLSYKYL